MRSVALQPASWRKQSHRGEDRTEDDEEEAAQVAGVRVDARRGKACCWLKEGKEGMEGKERKEGGGRRVGEGGGEGGRGKEGNEGRGRRGRRATRPLRPHRGHIFFSLRAGPGPQSVAPARPPARKKNAPSSTP